MQNRVDLNKFVSVCNFVKFYFNFWLRVSVWVYGCLWRPEDPLELRCVAMSPRCGHWELDSGGRCEHWASLQPFPCCSFLGWPKGKAVSLTFSILFSHCPFLLPQGEDVERILDEWKEYKMGVPTYGAIILDETLENVSALIWRRQPLTEVFKHPQILNIKELNFGCLTCILCVCYGLV